MMLATKENIARRPSAAAAGGWRGSSKRASKEAKQIMEMGFGREQAEAALAKAEGSVEQATAMLLGVYEPPEAPAGRPKAKAPARPKGGLASAGSAKAAGTKGLPAAGPANPTKTTKVRKAAPMKAAAPPPAARRSAPRAVQLDAAPDDSVYEAQVEAQLRQAIEESRLQGRAERKARRDEADAAPLPAASGRVLKELEYSAPGRATFSTHLQPPRAVAKTGTFHSIKLSIYFTEFTQFLGGQPRQR
jgi:hypothetical protein